MTVPIVDINWVAVIVAAIVSMALGAFWYSPAGFGKQWVALMGFTDQQQKAMKKGAGKAYALAFIGALITSAVLAMLVDWAQAITMIDGAKVGFWIWLGFVATTMAGMMLWEGKPMKLYTLNSGYHLVNFILMGAILAAWM